MHEVCRNTNDTRRVGMGVFSRFMDIINANINALLDKAEDPEKMLKLMMQEMEDTLIELKSNCAARMASKIRLEKKLAEQKALIDRWQGRAQMAVGRGRDDLAREALLEKRKAAEALARIQDDIKSYEEVIEESRKEIDQLEVKLSQARSKLRVLQEKAKAAREAAAVDSQMGRDGSRHFDDLEEMVDRMEAERELNKPRPSSDEVFRSMEEKEAIDRELEELKKEVGR